MDLPNAFLMRMKKMLGSEYGDYLREMERPRYRGIRLNPLKSTKEILFESFPYSLSPSNFDPNCYLLETEEKLGFLPAFHAGMFYAQEPSASAPVHALAPKPGEKVLDLCAAPGGKATQIAAYMQGEGILWANEYIRARAAILKENITRLGVRNAVISQENPEKLCRTLQGYFDRVLVDAPCSGEGMFRKSESARTDWSTETVEACAARQKAILDSAALAVKHNGVLVYSTCTFSQSENEDVVLRFLKEHSDFELEPICANYGRPALGGLPALRIYPMDGGEGHFIAKFRRLSENRCKVRAALPRHMTEATLAAKTFLSKHYPSCNADLLAAFASSVHLLPKDMPATDKLHVINAGVVVGDYRKNRIEPAHDLFMAMPAQACRQGLSFSQDEQNLFSFLRGEEIAVDLDPGYAVIMVNGVSVGFGKITDGKLKNKYPKRLRLRK